MRIRYNAPVTLTFTLFAAVVLVVSQTIAPGIILSFFSTPVPFRTNVFVDYVRRFTHVLGHENIQHFIGNFTMILL